MVAPLTRALCAGFTIKIYYTLWKRIAARQKKAEEGAEFGREGEEIPGTHGVEAAKINRQMSMDWTGGRSEKSRWVRRAGSEDESLYDLDGNRLGSRVTDASVTDGEDGDASSPDSSPDKPDPADKSSPELPHRA
jgi:hypothetical protein